MGSYPEGKTSTANDINCAQVQLFNRQVEKMKFENNKQIFKERSKQTKDALDIALMNLKQNKLLQTSYFKKLNKKTDKQRNDNNKRQRLKTEKANTIKKMIFMDKQASYTSQKNKSQSNLNKIQNSDRNTIKRERKSKFEPIYVITQKSNA